MRTKDQIRDAQSLTLPESLKGFYDRAFAGSKANAIKAKCLECCCNSRTEVHLCEVFTCPLFEVRPYQKYTPRSAKEIALAEQKLGDTV